MEYKKTDKQFTCTPLMIDKETQNRPKNNKKWMQTLGDGKQIKILPFNELKIHH